MDSIPTKISWKKHVLFYIVFQVLKVLIINICKIQLPDLLFPVVFINFYISRDDFSQIFITPFSIIWKKDFRHKFFFFKSAKRGRSLLSMLPYPIRFSWEQKSMFYCWVVKTKPIVVSQICQKIWKLWQPSFEESSLMWSYGLQYLGGYVIL